MAAIDDARSCRGAQGGEVEPAGPRITDKPLSKPSGVPANVSAPRLSRKGGKRDAKSVYLIFVVLVLVVVVFAARTATAAGTAAAAIASPVLFCLPPSDRQDYS